MGKIILDIEDKNLPIVLNILENLKHGLINNIEKQTNSHVKPISSSLSKQGNKKYLSKDKYKQKIQNQKILEDEFLPKKVSGSRYLSKEEFKAKLKGK